MPINAQMQEIITGGIQASTIMLLFNFLIHKGKTKETYNFFFFLEGKKRSKKFKNTKLVK